VLDTPVTLIQKQRMERISEHAGIVADTDELVVVEFRYPPGRSGADPHIHHGHSDTFYVLEGELVFRVGRELERIVAPAGTYVGAPPGVVHTFRNEGSEPARFLNFHAPSCGFAAYMRDLVAARDTSWFDQDHPPPDGGPPASAAIYVLPDPSR
jgi:quercetin dioxygenase-like cupin family protein